MVNTDNILEFQHVTKKFPGIIANEDVNLAIKRGEIHALLGENGAGKSTLMNVLVGLYTPEEGNILVNGEKVEIKTPKDSIALGIGMVHQHFKLVDTLTVAENIIIGLESQGFRLNMDAICDHIKEISESFNLPVDPRAKVGDLSAGEKQRVEIVKMLYRNVDLLILDEPTSVLAPQEVEQLFEYLRKMKAENKTVIFISHKLDEVMSIADRVTVLRRGKLIETLNTEDTNPEDLARRMIGKEMTVIEKVPTDFHNAKVLFEAKDVCAKDEEGVQAVDNVSFQIRAGEILGIAGVSGNGQNELAEVVTGLRTMLKGSVYVDGTEVNGGAKGFIDAGVGHIPEDRIGTGTIPDFTVLENVCMKRYKEAPLKKGIFMNRSAMAEFGEPLMKAYDVRMSSSGIPVRQLSGGNMQKMICAREIEKNPKVIVAVHPTYGLDVSAVNMIHGFLRKEQQKGAAILFISEDLDELLEISDTLAVMFHHNLTPKRNVADWTVDEIGFAMMGITEEQRHQHEQAAAEGGAE